MVRTLKRGGFIIITFLEPSLRLAYCGAMQCTFILGRITSCCLLCYKVIETGSYRRHLVMFNNVYPGCLMLIQNSYQKSRIYVRKSMVYHKFFHSRIVYIFFFKNFFLSILISMFIFLFRSLLFLSFLFWFCSVLFYSF